ncbi:hypothetical protein [Helicobacter rodentium]|uniref:hypothetical protein n=1 Tax=Helicobacter rodentium TaxID=59617 RepID=UPI0023F00961|nr:hypothetical protein [Helicobacter rodentium]
MSDKELEIFELCEKLTELLGDKEAIADLKALWKRHPEMFKDMQEVSKTIQEVVSKPEIAVDANKDNRDYEVIKVAKILNTEKMADVVIKNEKGTNEIFHANKKRIGEFDRLKSKENLLQVETPTPSTHQLNGLELIDKNLSSANALSTIDDDIIPQTNENQSIAEQIKAESKDFDTLSTNERLALLEKNQQAIAGMRMQSAKDLQQQNKDSMSIKQEKELKDSKNQESQIHKLKKRK